MKSTLKKSMAMILVVLMALSCCAVSSFAAASNVTFSVEKIALPEEVAGDEHSKDIAIYGNYLYLNTHDEALKVYNIANPEAPVLVYTMGTELYGYGGAINNIYFLDILGDTLFMAFQAAKDGDKEMAIVRSFSLANPAQPTYKATFGTFWNNNASIEVLNSGSLICSYGNGWDLYANAQKATGTVTRSSNITSGGWKVYQSETGNGTIRYRESSGNRYISLTTGAKETVIAYRAFATVGDYIYVLRDNALDAVYVPTGADFMDNYKNSSKTTTIDLTSLNFDEMAVGERGVVANNHLYFFSANGILELDVTDPAAPKNQRTLAGGAAQNAVAYGNYFYTVNEGTVSLYKTASSGISMQRQAEILAPAADSNYTATGITTRSVVSVGDYVFFGDGGDADGLSSYNVKNGILTKGITTRLAPEAANMILDGNYIYAALQNGTVQRVDVTNPAAPVLDMVFKYNNGGIYGALWGIAKLGDTLYVYGNTGYCRIQIPEEGDVANTTSKNSTGNLRSGTAVLAFSDSNIYGVASNVLYKMNDGAADTQMDTGVNAVYADNGYLYIIKNDTLKVVKEADIYDNGAFSADLYAENAYEVSLNGGNGNWARAFVKYDNYLLCATDTLLVFDITNPAQPVKTSIGSNIAFSTIPRGMAVNNGVLYVVDNSSTVRRVNLAYETQEVVSTEITALPVTFAGTAAGVSAITLAVGSDEYTVPVVDGKWSKTITEVSDENGAITVTAIAGASEVSANYTLNLPVEEPAELTVSVTYTNAFNANVTIENNTDSKRFMVILVVYNGNEIYDVDYKVISDDDTLSCTAPSGDLAGYTAKTFVWSDLMVPFLTVPAAN